MSTLLPKQIRRYRILSELGRGSMGRVYLAEDPNIERWIALKVLTPERLSGAGGEELRRRFLHEARAAGSLSHRGIVTIYDADTDPESGYPYLAMEWVRGCSLKALLHRDGPAAPARAVSMTAQVARALDYAHRQNVVHRDVKPANLLVTGDDTVKVADFGIAKLVSKSLSRPGRVLGRPHYMAPEQIRGLAVDGRTDLFALGAVLYESLTGRFAFGGDTVASVTHKILSFNPRPIDDPEVPPSLRAVVRRALEKLPGDRYRSGAELAAALETVGAELALAPQRPRRRRDLRPSPSSTGADALRASAPGFEPSANFRGQAMLSSLLGAGRVSESAVTGNTTTEVLGRVPGAPAPGEESPSADIEPMAAAADWRWPRAAALVALALMIGVVFGRSVDPQILDVPNWQEAMAAPVTNPEEGAVDREDVVDREDAAASPETEAEEPAESPAAAAMDPPEVAVALVAEAEADRSDWNELATTHLEIIFENRLKLADFSVWIDGSRAFLVKLETKNPFTRIKGREHRWSIPVPAGERRLEIRVSGPAKQLEARGEIQRTFSADDPQRLIVELWPDSRQLGLQWESLPISVKQENSGGRIR